MNQQTEELLERKPGAAPSNRWLVFRVVVITVVAVAAILAACYFRKPAWTWIKGNLNYILVAFVPVIVAASAVLRSLAEKSVGRVKIILYLSFWLIVVIGAGASVYVTRLTADSSARDAVIRGKEQERRDREEAQRQTKIDESLHDLRAQRGIAKRDDSDRIVHEKLRYVEPDIDKWAATLGDPSREAEFGKIKSQAEQRQITEKAARVKEEVRISEQSHRYVRHAMDFVAKSLEAYKRAKGKNIVIDPVNVPINFYEKKTSYFFRLTDEAIWQVDLEGGGETCLFRITFKDASGHYSGKLHLYVIPDKDQFNITYDELAMEIIEHSEVNKNGKLADCDSAVKSAFLLILEEQLYKVYGSSSPR